MKGSILNTITGLWLMFAPAVLNYGNPAADNDHIFGPLVITFGVISFSDVTRTVNKWNLPIGLWMFVAPMILGYTIPSAAINSFLTGILIVLFSLSNKKAKQTFGGGWKILWKN